MAWKINMFETSLKYWECHVGGGGGLVAGGGVGVVKGGEWWWWVVDGADIRAYADLI